MRKNRIKLSRVQDPGLRFWQTKSFAIITYATVPGNFIDRVPSQNGDRVIFERLATPRPAPKVTLKSNWRTEQQQQQQRQPQQPVLDKDVARIWTQCATGTGVRDDTKHATEVERTYRKLVQAASEADAGIHLTEKEALTDVFSNNGANTQEIERVKTGSEQNLYSGRPSEGEDGVQQRIQPCHFRKV